ncbi:MAG: hypothetical protein KIH03_03075 [Paludibacteraceae bacterium]|nr:hypothetical protein [Paludibacteraceae bacterium]
MPVRAKKVESEYVIASFSIPGAINKSGLVYVTAASRRTDFIRVKEGIKIKAYDGAISYSEYAAVTFYNANFEFISTMEFSTDGLKEITFTSSNIPSNAECIIEINYSKQHNKFSAINIKNYIQENEINF